MSEEVIIEYIDTAASLAKLSGLLGSKKEFAFDTEFDRFYREYGFKLSLLQIFEGNKCYLVDPISIKDLSPLWPVFEEPGICKVVYSCSEDIQLLKVNGCNPQNIYDIQIAAKLCNHPATSLSALMSAEFGIESDKTLQRSNWRRRPLSKEQIAYAGNDVSRLLHLKHLLETLAAKRGVTEMIFEENKACERIPVTEYEVKLSVNQRKKYSPALQKSFLELLHFRNDIAMYYNVPPSNIVTDATLESIVEQKQEFLSAPFNKGFSKRFTEDMANREKFMEIIKNIRAEYVPRVPKPKKEPFFQQKVKDEAADVEFDRKYALLYNDIVTAYGKEAGEYILRGFKKMVTSTSPGRPKLKAYQHNIIREACKKLNIHF